MSEHPYLSDDQQSRKENALKAAMPYILFERHDAYAVPRDGADLDFWGAVRDALRALWRRGEAQLYPMPRATGEATLVADPTEDRGAA